MKYLIPFVLVLAACGIDEENVTVEESVAVPTFENHAYVEEVFAESVVVEVAVEVVEEVVEVVEEVQVAVEAAPVIVEAPVEAAVEEVVVEQAVVEQAVVEESPTVEPVVEETLLTEQSGQ